MMKGCLSFFLYYVWIVVYVFFWFHLLFHPCSLFNQLLNDTRSVSIKNGSSNSSKTETMEFAYSDIRLMCVFLFKQFHFYCFLFHFLWFQFYDCVRLPLFEERNIWMVSGLQRKKRSSLDSFSIFWCMILSLNGCTVWKSACTLHSDLYDFRIC